MNYSTGHCVKAHRPLGLTILAWLDIIIGFLGIAISLLLLALHILFERNPDNVGNMITLFTLLVGMPFYVFSVFSIVRVFAGVAQLRGHAWGWYFCTYDCLWYVVLTILPTTVPIHTFFDDPLSIIARSWFGITIAILLYFYYVRDSVLDYFILAHVSVTKVIVVQIFIAGLMMYAIRYSQEMIVDSFLERHALMIRPTSSLGTI